MFSSPSLDRSPSLSSNSSGASSAGSLAPITPALQSSSTFASPRIDEVDEFGSSTPMKAMVSAGGGGRPLTKVSTTSPWSAGHRTGGGTKSFDAARSLFANKEKDSIAGGGGAVRAPSPTLRGSPFARPSDSLNASSPGSNASPWARAGSPVRSTSPFKLQELGSSGRSSPTPSSVPFPPSSPTRLSSSPTRFGASTSPTRPPLPTIPSDRATSSPSHRASPSFSASSSPNPNPLNQSQRERVLSSAIFSTRDRPSSPALGGSPDFGSATGGGGGGSPGMQRMGSLAGRAGGMGHKRAMTLPQLGLGANGLPVPMMRGEEQGGERGVGLGLGKKMQSLVIEEDVPGLPGRARLSRPASSASPFAPSAVFNSSHGLSSSASTPHSLSTSTSPSSPPKQRVPQAPQRAQTLLPSQTVKAMDNQRKDLVAYEYLCHLAEARDWLTSHISTSTAPLSELCGETINDFEQSLRNGYALAHLARSLGGERCKGPIYNDPTRHFRHTVNINIFFNLVDEVGLPEIFRFETVDLYDAKNLPKVVYCIHALSYLMARQGLTGQMADLVGKVDFTDAEVGAAQKGLNDAGVRMPDFGGLAKALNRHEPVAETDEQRQHRELLAATHGVVALQSHARGALARRAFAARVQQQRALERQRAKAKAEEAQRVREEEERRRVEEAEEAKRVQAEEEAERRRAAEEAERRRVAEEQERLRLAEEAERRRIAEEEERQRLADEEEERQYQAAVLEAARTMVGFQASARGALLRRRFYDTIEQLSVQHRSVVGFQAAARAALVRRQLERKRVAFSDSSASIVGLQAVCRSVLARQALLDRIQELRSAESFIVGVQSHIRGLLSRRTFAAKARDLRKTEVVRSVGGLQSLARAALTRRRLNTQRQALGFVEPDVVGIQAQTRGFLARRNFLEWRDNVYRNEDAVIYLQSVLRGVLARRKYYNLHRHFHENLASVVRMQAAIRSRRQGSQYRQLKVGKNVPVGTIKNFMRLLDDSEFDYRGELQLESLRKELVSAIRETQDLEDDVKDLDTKIALLVKNKITHEVARAQRAGSSRGLAPQTRSNLLSAANDPFAGGALDRTTQHKLDMYQQLFWHLQTKPQYLARLFANTARLGISDKVQKAIEATTFVVFGYAQGHREEFLLLKLLQCSLQEEISHLPDAGAFVRGQFTFIRLLTQYGRGVSQRQYLTGTLGPEVKAVMQRQGLDLGTDPITIYRADIAREEEHTGLPSQRPKDVELKQAVADKATNEAFIAHLLSLRQATSSFLQAIIGSTRTMPFGIRYIAREVFRALRAQFSQQSEADALRVAGHLVYYRFLQPAILAPETYGIVESVISPIQRKNLAEVCKMLNQISVGRVFGEEQPYLKPMNQFLATSSAQFTRWIYDIINVENAETHFRADEYIDAAAARRPVIYISPNDIYSTHSVLAEHIDVIAPEEDDPVRKVIYELGGAPSGSSAELSRARVDEIALTLATRLSPQEDPNAGNKHLFNQAKRRVLSILKIHHGNDLEAVLARQVTEDDEDAWAQAVEEEEIEERRRAHEERRPVVLQLDDIRNMSFAQLKMATLGDIVQLRKLGLVKREDKYQAILDAIARDIHMKHHRRVQRTNELQTMHATLTSLKDKKRYLDDQIKSYHLYIDQSMAGIQKKSNKRLVLPWSLQASHERSLEKSGKRYKFGSYKYSARKLYDRGVLLSIDQHSPKQFSKISLVISSNDVGVFEVKAEFLGMPATTVELKLEDLLESQFVGKQTINIGDVAKCSIPLLLNLINRKFSE